MDEYPEHAKLAAIADKSQVVGEFVEWLGSLGVHLREWKETDLPEECSGEISYECLDGIRGPLPGSFFPAGHHGKCRTCGGKGEVIVHHEGWVPAKPGMDLLSEFFEIDRDKIEAEKRAMLAKLQERNKGG